MASLPLVSMATLFHSVRKEMKIKQKPLPLTLVKDTREPQRNVFLSMKPLPLKKTMIGHFATLNDFILPEEPKDEEVECVVALTPDHYWQAAEIRAGLQSRKPTEPGEIYLLTREIVETLTKREHTTKCIVAIYMKMGIVLGSLDFKKPGNDEDPDCQITNMAILEGVKGIDTIMLNHVKERAKGLGARAVIARVSGSNSSEKRFYEKYGFEHLLEDKWMLKI